LACNASCSFPTLTGGNRLIANLPAVATSDVDLELRSLPSAGITRFPRYYGPLRLPWRPGLSLAGVRLAHAATAGGLPCCAGSPCADMPSPLPRWDRRCASLVRHRRQRPSPSPCQVGSHIEPFRGLLGVHVSYGLPARGVALRPFASEASAVLLPPPPPRLLPAGATVAGEELHLLKIRTFSRRTRGRTRGRGSKPFQWRGS
jgi:hypothetical protein